MEQMTRRKLWLDGLRAVAMLLVILGHLLPGCSAFFVFTGPVKLPLFFAISVLVAVPSLILLAWLQRREHFATLTPKA